MIGSFSSRFLDFVVLSFKGLLDRLLLSPMVGDHVLRISINLLPKPQRQGKKSMMITECLAGWIEL